MPYTSSPCRLNDHRRCPGTAPHFDELHECACPCHYDYPTRQRRPTPTPRLQNLTTRDTEPPAGYLPAGLQGARHARLMLIAIVLATILYLAICTITMIAQAAAPRLMTH